MVKLLRLLAIASSFVLGAGAYAQEAAAEAAAEEQTYDLSAVAPGHLETACSTDCDAYVCVQGVRAAQHYSHATAIYHNEMIPAHREFCNARGRVSCNNVWFVPRRGNQYWVHALTQCRERR